MHIVILAGGGGNRLWPLSRKGFPKQFLHLGMKESLLKQTVCRFVDRPFIETIIVSTNIAYEPLVRQELAGIDVHILVEPVSKNTAPAIGFAIRYLEEICEVSALDPILILPSDHLIEPQEIFLDYIQHGLAVSKSGKIVAFGIRPTRPETGYGYIRIGERLDAFSYRVEEFVEKPNPLRAKGYSSNPTYYWNTGILALTAATFWAESFQHYPQICRLRELSWHKIEAEFAQLDDISIDYAFMEKTGNVVVCPLPVTWSDVGSWENVYEVLDKDENQNVKIGNIVEFSTKNCLIFGGKRVISTIGLEDLVIVDTEDGLLIAKKTDSQRVKDIVQVMQN